jgi:hypothetical protein
LAQINFEGNTGLTGVDISRSNTYSSTELLGLLILEMEMVMFMQNKDTVRWSCRCWRCARPLSVRTTAWGEYTEQMRLTSTGDLRFNSGYGSVATAYGCRAWVNFNGTGTVAIRASGNVSSITDNGTGDYTVNFYDAMPDANYARLLIAGALTSGGTMAGNIATPSSTAYLTMNG